MLFLLSSHNFTYILLTFSNNAFCAFTWDVSYSYPGLSQHALLENSGHVGSPSNTSGPACCQHSAAALPWRCLGVVVLTPRTWNRALQVQYSRLTACSLQIRDPVFAAQRMSLCINRHWQGRKLLFKFAQMRKVQSKPIANIKDQVTQGSVY